jgi:hypothetical protein
MASSKQAKSTTTTSSVLTSKINHGSDKGKADAMSTSKGINGVWPKVLELEYCIKQWIPYRGKVEKYMPLEFFLPPKILNDMNCMITVEKISKEFELERLKRILDLDKKKSIGNKRLLVQERIDHLKNFGKDYTRLEIAAARINKGPKKDQQIWDYIAFLNEKNILDTWVTH